MAEKDRRDASERGRQERIAVAAYYNAERRGFGAGGEVEDWLEAERQVDGNASEKGSRGEAAAQQPDGADVSSGINAAAERPDYPDLNEAGIEHVEPDQVGKWARRLKVPAPKLREAMQRVGPVISDIKRFLGNSP
jgi:hypothetical protein